MIKKWFPTFFGCAPSTWITRVSFPLNYIDLNDIFMYLQGVNIYSKMFPKKAEMILKKKRKCRKRNNFSTYLSLHSSFDPSGLSLDPLRVPQPELRTTALCVKVKVFYLSFNCQRKKQTNNKKHICLSDVHHELQHGLHTQLVIHWLPWLISSTGSMQHFITGLCSFALTVQIPWIM